MTKKEVKIGVRGFDSTNNKSSIYVAGKQTKVLLYAIAMVILLSTVPQLSFSQSNVCLSPNMSDRDGDRISNRDEINGIDADNDGNVDLNLSALGANPRHKDLFLEIDYMTNHRPYAPVIPDVVRAFQNSPVCNPDGINGITLHAQLDESISEEPITDLNPDVPRLKEIHFGSQEQRADPNSANILQAKETIYHYAIFAHSQTGTSSSGIANLPGMNFIVTLGNGWPVNPQTNHSTGTPSQQAGTLLHEFGHNLNLGHGGVDHTNLKPNYLSVMNYNFQFPTPVASRPLSYSSCALDTLNKNSLSEPTGIKPNCPIGANTYVSCPTPGLITALDRPVDYSRDGDTTDVGVRVNVNCDRNVFASLLLGYDDWSNLQYVSANEGLGVPAEGINGTSSSLTNSTNIGNGTNNTSPVEMNLENVTQLNLDLLAQIDNAVNVLPNGSFQTPPSFAMSMGDEDTPQSAKSFYNRELGISNEGQISAALSEEEGANDTIAGQVASGNIDEAITGLNNLRSTMDSSFGGSQADDLIVDPQGQELVSSKVSNAIEALKTQSCTYSNCTFDSIGNSTK
jgi:hypothetical protein